MILLDTHAFIWFSGQSKKISARANKAVLGARRRFISDSSLWECAMLSSSGRLKLDRDCDEWMQSAIEENEFDVISISPKIACRAQHLGALFHGDPADRLIVATAVELGASLITADEKIHQFSGVTTIW